MGGGVFMRRGLVGEAGGSWVSAAITKGTLPHLSQFHTSSDTSHPWLILTA